MKRVVISQPMFFPWVGLLEQVRLADVFVHYDDVAFSKGSFTNRVQIKTERGARWLTVPHAGLRLGQAIRDVAIDEKTDWRAKHLAFLEQSFRGAPHADEALELARAVYARRDRFLGELAIASVEAVGRALGLGPPGGFVRSSALGIGGRSSERVLAIVLELEGDVYVTGHGARNYLDHGAFERAGVRVEYMAYEKRPYPQLHGPFTPSVSSLDLIANAGGAAGRAFVASGTTSWREFLAAREARP